MIDVLFQSRATTNKSPQSGSFLNSVPFITGMLGLLHECHKQTEERENVFRLSYHTGIFFGLFVCLKDFSLMIWFKLIWSICLKVPPPFFFLRRLNPLEGRGWEETKQPRGSLRRPEGGVEQGFMFLTVLQLWTDGIKVKNVHGHNLEIKYGDAATRPIFLPLNMW